MTLENFFIDTADVDYIKGAWEKLATVFTGKELVGITTNPNAMAKVNINSISEMEEKTKQLCTLVSDIRGDSKGVVYVQGPSSEMTSKDLVEFAKMVCGWSDGATKVALKIPPFSSVLDSIDQINNYTDVNVTGVADCSTALRCFSYNVRYVSVIPGRMEEKGINAKQQIDFINERKGNHNKAEIITGSMRTVEGLEWAIQYKTVPTIGTRVFDQIFDQGLLEQFKKMWTVQHEPEANKFSPLVTQDMTNLSIQFFEQMDELGLTTYQDWKKFYKK